MEKTSTASDLQKRLMEKREQDQSQARELILKEQKTLLNDLASSYKAGLDTTLNGIQEVLQARLGRMALLTASEAQTVETMVEDHKKRLNEILSQHYLNAQKQLESQIDPVRMVLDQAKRSADQAKTSAEKMTQAAERSGSAFKELEKRMEASAKRERQRWFIVMVIALIVLLVICFGSWGLIQYLSSQVEKNLMTIDEQRAVIQMLDREAYGVRVREFSNGIFLLLPPGTQDGFKFGEASAIRLPAR